MSVERTTIANSLDKIARLETPGGFVKWEREIKDFLGMNGFQALLVRDKTRPTQRENEDTATYQDRVERWEDKQERACAVIRHRCGFNAREEIKDSSTVDEILSKLKLRFQPKGSAIFQQLDFNYLDLSLEKCKGISEFAEKLREARNEIQDLDETCKISEPHFVNKFLTGLGPAYSIFLTSFYQTHRLIPERDSKGEITKEAVTFDDAVIAAEKEEQAQQFTERNKEATVLLAHAQTGTRVCGHCHKTGHLREKCWRLYPDERKVFDERRRFQKKRREGIKQRKRDEDFENAGAILEPASTLAYQPKWQPGTETNVILTAAMLPAASFSTTTPTAARLPNLLQDNWLVDTGCNNHASCRREVFLKDTLIPYRGPPVIGYGGSNQAPELVGTARVPCNVGGKLVNLFLRNTFYHPMAACNIISTTQLRYSGASLAFCSEGISINSGGTDIIAEEKYGLYLLRLWKDEIVPSPQAFLAYSITEPWLDLWHQRLGHLGQQNLKRLVRMSTGMRPLPDGCTCIHCVNAKLKEVPHNHPFKRGEYPLEFIHIDLSGRMPKGRDGEEYWVTIVDDCTGLTDVTPIRKKSELPLAVQRFLEKNERPERRCHRARIDQAGENLTLELADFLRDRGVAIEPTGTEQHQANGVAEVAQRLILERTHATLSSADLSLKYWPYIAEAIGHLRMFTPHSRLEMTPYQAWFGDIPDLSHLRILGSHCIAYRTGHRKKLQEDKGIRCRLLGYQGTKTYKLLKENGEVILSANVVFLEKRACPREFEWNGNPHSKPSYPAGSLPPSSASKRPAASGGRKRMSTLTQSLRIRLAPFHLVLLMNGLLCRQRQGGRKRMSIYWPWILRIKPRPGHFRLLLPNLTTSVRHLHCLLCAPI